MAQGDAAGGPRCSSLTILPVPLIAEAVAAGRRPLMLASQVGAVPAAASCWRLLAAAGAAAAAAAAAAAVVAAVHAATPDHDGQPDVCCQCMPGSLPNTASTPPPAQHLWPSSQCPTLLPFFP